MWQNGRVLGNFTKEEVPSCREYGAENAGSQNEVKRSGVNI